MKERKCEFCGEPFVPNSNFQRYCKRPHYMNCPVCGKQYLVTNNENLKRPPVACSYACRVKRTQQTSLEKYGVVAPGNNPEAREKAKKTMVERYGAEYTLQSKELKARVDATVQERYRVDNIQQNRGVRDRTTETNLKRYGSTTFLTTEIGKAAYQKALADKYNTDHPLHSEEIKEKLRQTCIERYGSPCYFSSEDGIRAKREAALKQFGVDHFSKAPEIRERIKQTCIERYGVDNPSKSSEIVAKIRQTMLNRYGCEGTLSIPKVRKQVEKTSLERYGVPYYVMLPEVSKSSGRISKLNIRCKERFEENRITAELEHMVGQHSYDLYLPDKNMIVEINPSYTHNVIGNHWNDRGLEPEYHMNRCKECIDNNVDIRCVFDWDSFDNILKEVMNPKLVTDVNDLHVYRLKPQAYRTFLDQFGHSRTRQYHRKEMAFGLVSDGKLYQVILIQPDDTFLAKIVDYGTAYGYYVENGLTTILQYVFELFDKDEIAFYVDFDRITLADIQEMKLRYSYFTYPKLYWSKNRNIVLNKRSTNAESMLENGWLPVYDCGQAVYTF